MLPPEEPSASAGLLAALIEHLSDRDPQVRSRAAREIFALALARAAPYVNDWLRHADVAACFVMEDRGAAAKFPRATVGIAVQPAALERIRTANASPPLADVPPDLDAKEFELAIDLATRLDILTTRDPHGDGAIARFLRKYGEGIQQMELEVHSVDRTTELLRTHFGLAPILPRARPGAGGTRVNFFLLSGGSQGKLLIELVEAHTADP